MGIVLTQPPPSPSTVAEELGPIPFSPPDGKRWIPVWTLIDSSSAPITDHSFEEVILNRIKPSEAKEPMKRRKIPDPHAKVITHFSFVEASNIETLQHHEFETEALLNQSGSESEVDENDIKLPTA